MISCRSCRSKVICFVTGPVQSQQRESCGLQQYTVNIIRHVFKQIKKICLTIKPFHISYHAMPVINIFKVERNYIKDIIIANRNF